MCQSQAPYMNLAMFTHIATRFHVPEDRRGCYKVQPLKTMLCFRRLSAHHVRFTSAIKFRRRNIGSARLRFRKIDIKAAAIPDEISPIVGTFNCPKRPTPPPLRRPSPASIFPCSRNELICLPLRAQSKLCCSPNEIPSPRSRSLYKGQVSRRVWPDRSHRKETNVR